MPNAYKVTYSKVKIYVGVDDLDLKASCFGSPSRATGREIEADFTAEQLKRFAVEEEILWESADASKAEATAVEGQWIRRPSSNNPEVGCNRNPRWTGITLIRRLKRNNESCV